MNHLPAMNELVSNITHEKQTRTVIKVGRNELCPCGSGKKYKKCHLFQNEGFKQDTTTHSWQKPNPKTINAFTQQVNQKRGNPLADIPKYGIASTDENNKTDEQIAVERARTIMQKQRG